MHSFSMVDTSRLKYPARIAVISMLLIVVLDYASGLELKFGVFYLIPVLLAATASKRLGLIYAVISASLALLINWHLGRTHSTPLYYAWDFMTDLTIFSLVAIIRSNLLAANQSESKMARTDPLTGLTNMRAFHELAQSEIYRVARYNRPITLAYVDIDNFKTVNDVHGHHEGDKLLRAVAESMQGGARMTDIVSRIGGDEFVILLPETTQGAAQVVMGQIHKRLQEKIQQHNWPVTFSIGVLTCTGTPPSVEYMIQAADTLMYGVKKQGKNAISYSELVAAA